MEPCADGTTVESMKVTFWEQDDKELVKNTEVAVRSILNALNLIIFITKRKKLV